MKTNYHTRSSYEQLYGWLQKATDKPGLPAKDMSDQDLLMTINYILILQRCQPFSTKELKAQLY